MEKNEKIFIAGHRGMVGSALLRKLKGEGFTYFVLPGSQQLDLRVQAGVEEFFEREKPCYVFLAAAKVGGIMANNTYRAEFIYDNLMIQNNVIHQAWKVGVKKLLFLGSSCIYPRLAPQPMNEDALLTGALEPTNQWYAIAKISGLMMCQAYRRQHGCDYISAMPTNLYGPGDNFHPQESHVPAATVLKMHNAKLANVPSVEIWGTGTPKREFLYVDDLADACVFLMERYSAEQTVNVGTGADITIKELGEIVARVVGYRGKFTFDT